MHWTRRYTPQETLAYVNGSYFAPATGWHYSNMGYVLLGLIVEAVTGRPVASEIRARFLEPLKLRSTYLAEFEPATGELAHGFRCGRHRRPGALGHYSETGDGIGLPSCRCVAACVSKLDTPRQP